MRKLVALWATLKDSRASCLRQGEHVWKCGKCGRGVTHTLLRDDKVEVSPWRCKVCGAVFEPVSAVEEKHV